jgi:hypothetical protein
MLDLLRQMNDVLLVDMLTFVYRYHHLLLQLLWIILHLCLMEIFRTFIMDNLLDEGIRGWIIAIFEIHDRNIIFLFMLFY